MALTINVFLAVIMPGDFSLTFVLKLYSDEIAVDSVNELDMLCDLDMRNNSLWTCFLPF